jgi:hypothetical protein
MIVLRVKEAKHSKRETVCKYLDSFEALSLVVDKPWRCILDQFQRFVARRVYVEQSFVWTRRFASYHGVSLVCRYVVK